MRMIKRLYRLPVLLVVSLPFTALAGTVETGVSDVSQSGAEQKPVNSKEVFTYLPVIHATLRPRYEAEIDDDYAGRFEVRNARLSAEGYVCPVVDYKLQADLCDKGKFKMLDVWVGLSVAKGFKIITGQTLMPFSVDGVRSPHNYLFANKSYAGEIVGNTRGVGAKLCYSPLSPLQIEAGVFNNATISDHDVWEKDPVFAAKARYMIGEVAVECGFKTAAPDSVRINFLNGVVSWKSDRWQIEGEYTYKHYTNHSFNSANAYSCFASYGMPVNAGIFNRLSFQGRWDGMTDHSTGIRNSDGHLYLTDKARNRLTLGSTISYIQSPKVKVDMRLNYEKYFYPDDYEAPRGSGDKIVVELALRF